MIKLDTKKLRLLESLLLLEADYPKALGISELFAFYDVATKSQISQLQKYLDNIERKRNTKENVKKAWQLVQKVTKMKLSDKEFN